MESSSVTTFFHRRKYHSHDDASQGHHGCHHHWLIGQRDDKPSSCCYIVLNSPEPWSGLLLWRWQSRRNRLRAAGRSWPEESHLCNHADAHWERGLYRLLLGLCVLVSGRDVGRVTPTGGIIHVTSLTCLRSVDTVHQKTIGKQGCGLADRPAKVNLHIPPTMAPRDEFGSPQSPISQFCNALMTKATGFPMTANISGAPQIQRCQEGRISTGNQPLHGLRHLQIFFRNSTV